MPDCLEEVVLKVKSVNTSGIQSSNEGADFKLEIINKQTQKWTPKVPSGRDWQTICGNYDALCDLRENTFTQIHVAGHSSQKRKET